MRHQPNVHMVEAEQELLRQYGAPICRLTVPAAVGRDAFAEGVRRVEAVLRANRLLELARRDVSGADWFVLLWAVRADAARLCGLMARLMEIDALGGWMPIDVLAPDGQSVLRAQQPAGDFAEVWRDFDDRRFADQAAGIATRSLLYELLVTPKPGLVDRANTGAHADMDTFTFAASTAALAPFFRESTLCGIAHAHEPSGQAFEHLRALGMLAEAEMLAVTGGVNTHKGALFSLGILCAVAGRLRALGQALTAEQLCQQARNMTERILRGEMVSNLPVQQQTAGQRVFSATKLSGARGEAAAGFPSVLHHALPVLREKLGEGLSINDAGVYALLALMCVAEDSNVVHRSSLVRRKQMMRAARDILRESPLRIDSVRRLDQELMDEHISPGGAADLLAVTFFLHLLCP